MKKYFLLIAIFIATGPALSQVKPSKNDANAQPSAATKGFCTALQRANYDMMDMFLTQGADINTPNCDGRGNGSINSALYRHIEFSNNMREGVELVQWLVIHRADVNLANSAGSTPLMLAVQVARKYNSLPETIGTMSLLLSKGATVSSRDKQGNAVLDYVRPSTEADILGADYNKAQFQRYQVLMQILLDAGANVNNANLLGETTLMHTVSLCAETPTKYLLLNNADQTLKNKLKQTALDIAIEKASNSAQNSSCNHIVKILKNPQDNSIVPHDAQAQDNSSPGAAGLNQFAGSYSGTYSGNDNGTFHTDISPSGAIALSGRSSANGQSFAGNGKIEANGSLAMSFGSMSTGATFNGSVNASTGLLTGTWENATTSTHGSFTGTKGGAAQPVKPTGNFLQDLNNSLGAINKALGKK